MPDTERGTSSSCYPVRLEVAAPLAMFARPDTGGTPISYPVPTFSAAMGLLHQIAFFADGAAWICPQRVDVCRRIGSSGGRVLTHEYTTNYGGPLRKSNLLSAGSTPGGSSMQLRATVLVDVCYRLYGTVVGRRRRDRLNPRHHLQALFERRIRRGECFKTPTLGWSEFTCSYWGPFREHVTEVDRDLELEIPSMLFSVWSPPYDGRYAPMYRQNVRVTAGVLPYDPPAEWVDAGTKER